MASSLDTGSAEQLQRLVARIERLEEDKAAVAADIKEVYAEAKDNGFDTKILRKVVSLRKLDKADLQQQDALIDLYKQALGMLADTPLGEAAIRGVAESRPGLRAHLGAAAE